MHLSRLIQLLLVLPVLIRALPITRPRPDRTIDEHDDVMFLDGLGYTNTTGTCVDLQAFVYPLGADRPGPMSKLASLLIKAIGTTHMDPSIAPDRLKMFAISRRSGKKIVVNVQRLQ